MPILMRVDENTRNKSSFIIELTVHARGNIEMYLLRDVRSYIVKRPITRIEHEKDTDKTYLAKNILNN